MLAFLTVLITVFGVKTDIIISRWKTGKVNRNEIETSGPMQFNAVLIQTENGLAASIKHIQRIL